ncbi:YhgE/Pip domain-containing protein [Pseudobutyrivibrio sp.]|uniref:YhgE/Pip domain-containing protein n=1 Tax=Pseudobutyrivibrio sp. TaxID=2014367 RepID=UPI001E0023B4|nr:YhgE/Pip domain-containing protein [Pseudobutyrivibrio sp.]MBE5911026.1 YhgE/Pip domain-containing protein [Pseudobutyrivibrio sp.]
MKTVRRIFFDDILSLVKNFFALVIVVGICLLPALYAWFNIFSNWDPYGSTGALKIAAISLDEGFTDENGEYHNQGDTIIDNLHENKSVDWQFVESSDAAIEGVYSGDYYAAVVIDKEFTYNMYNVLTEEVNRPTLHFYENQKKNPVATKISDTVVQTVQNNINVAFTEVVVSELFSNASEVSEELEEKGGVDAALDKLRSLSADLTNYQNTINSIIENDAALQMALAQAETDASNLQQQVQSTANAIASTGKVSANAATTIASYSNDVNSAIDTINAASDTMGQHLDAAAIADNAVNAATELKKALLDSLYIEKIVANLPNEIGDNVITEKKQEIISKLQNIETVISNVTQPLQAISDALGALAERLSNSGFSGIDDETLALLLKYNIITQDQVDAIKKIQDVAGQQQAVQDLITKINQTKTEIDNVIALVNGINYENIDTSNIEDKIDKINAIDVNTLALAGADQLKAMANSAKSEVGNVENLIGNDLATKLKEGLTSLSGTLNDTNVLLNSVGETFGNLTVMFSAIDNTIDCANTSLEKTNEAIVYVNGRLIDVIDDVESAASNEKMGVLVNALSGDPETYGQFFSTPVSVVTEAVYPIENYGSAVAPFYTTLAFWVGALILTAIIKIKPDKNKYPDASQRQLFFGRYVLYWVLGQLQAVIIVLGDLCLLHVQCLHPWLFMFAASVTATTFTILIYSLVATWGDVGKALSVVIVVIQIAGSSGTYPIELLPDFFKKVYIFFPFPYAINAIRECLCGLYELDYLKNLGCLCIFMIVALFIGLLVRIPFEPINHYMEERMEDTEMM